MAAAAAAETVDVKKTGINFIERLFNATGLRNIFSGITAPDTQYPPQTTSDVIKPDDGQKYSKVDGAVTTTDTSTRESRKRPRDEEDVYQEPVIARSARLLKKSKALGQPEASVDIDEYFPVFIYSHAMYATPVSGEMCKVYDPDVTSSDISDHFKSLYTINDYFMSVPDNMIVIDPIAPGYLCMSGYTADTVMPWLLGLFELSRWFSRERIESKYYLSSDVDGNTIKILKDFYNATKLYFSGDKINNLKLIFDINKKDNIPWNIRIPYADRETKTYKLQEILFEWTRQYSVRSENCIFLDDLVKKLQSETKNTASPLYKKKLALTFISCRSYPDKTYLTRYADETVYDLLLRYKAIKERGEENTSKYRSVVSRVLRPVPRGEAAAFGYELQDDKPVKSPEIIEQKTLEAVQYLKSLDNGDVRNQMYVLWAKGDIPDSEFEDPLTIKLRGGGKRRKYKQKTMKKSKRKQRTKPKYKDKARRNIKKTRKLRSRHSKGSKPSGKHMKTTHKKRHS